MTVSKTDYPSNHPAGLAFVDYDTEYEYTFYCRDPKDLYVLHVDTAPRVLGLGVDYEVYHDAGYSGGHIKLYSRYNITGGRLYIARRIKKAQQQSWAFPEKLLLTYLEGLINRINLIVQDLRVQAYDLLKNPRYRGAWAAGRRYTTGDLVKSGINLYIATTSFNGAATLAADISAGNFELVYDGDTYIAGYYTIPTITGADAYKGLRVNSGETGYEIAHIVPPPYQSALPGTELLMQNIDVSAYEVFDTNKEGVIYRPQFVYDASYKTYFNVKGPARFHHYEYGTLILASGTTLNIAAPDTASVWSYLYIKEPISGGKYLGSATCFYTSTAAPTYSPDKGGWYLLVGAKYYLCIFAMYFDGSKNSWPFYHESRSNRVLIQDRVYFYNNAAHPATFTAVQHTHMPPICNTSIANYQVSYGSGSAKYLYYRITGSAASNGLYFTEAGGNRTLGAANATVFVDSDRYADYKIVNGPAQLRIYGLGWELPKGM